MTRMTRPRTGAASSAADDAARQNYSTVVYREPHSEETNVRSAIEYNEQLIQALAEETDRQRASYSQRFSGLLTRASVLTAAASILTGLRVTEAASPGYITSIVTAALAAIAGGIVLIPRKGPEVDIKEAERSYWNEEPQEATRNFTAYKLDVLKADEKALFWRARTLFAGFGALAVSIAAAAATLLMSL